MLLEIGNKLISTTQVLWIDRITPGAGGQERCTIHFVGGENVTVTESFGMLSRLAGIIVPAPAGIRVVRACPPAWSDEDRTVLFDVEPAIAFRFQGEAGTLLDVFTPQGSAGDCYAVVAPDGTCQDYSQNYESIAAYKAAVTSRYAEPSARAAS